MHIIGTGATELLHIGQTVFNYPTLAECCKVAALNASNKLSG